MLRLSKHKNVVGLKEATGDMGRLEELKKVLANQINNKSFLLYSGDDPTAAQFILNGGIWDYLGNSQYSSKYNS